MSDRQRIAAALAYEQQRYLDSLSDMSPGYTPATDVESDVQSMFGMNPSAKRSAILPYYSKQTGLVAPEFLYQAAKAFTSPGTAARGGRVSAEDAANVAANVMGGGLAASAIRPVEGRIAGMAADGGNIRKALSGAKKGNQLAQALKQADLAEKTLRGSKEFAALKGQDKERAVRAARANAGESQAIARSAATLAEATGAEADIGRSAMGNPGYKTGGAVPAADIAAALQRRQTLRAEPATTPGPNASESDWANWGQNYGVNMTRTPDVDLGIVDPVSGRPVMIPGGLEGTFTIPDVFAIKGRNFNPSSLPKETHNALMKKFMRTYQAESPDDVDTFNALNFALLSPNAPLTQNEFLAARFRAQTPEDLQRIAGRTNEEGLAANLAAESGTGSALSGGMGVLGTADLGNQAELARLILQKPEMFKLQDGETVRDLTIRIMNQVPGLSQKTASLGTPWLNLSEANTSAVDLHMIRNNWDRMLDDPQVGDQFVKRMASLMKTEATPEAVRAATAANPAKAEENAIKVIGGSSTAQVYRNAKTGELVAGSRPEVSPEKLAYEPKTITDFNPFYKKIVDYVDESRGPNPELPLFPEQWRLWDTYRGRVEPHEFAHPDFKKLPKQSFTEMQNALTEHKAAGYTGQSPVMKEVDWRKLYYGKADPRLLGLLAAGAGGAVALDAARRNEEQR